MANPSPDDIEGQCGVWGLEELPDPVSVVKAQKENWKEPQRAVLA